MAQTWNEYFDVYLEGKTPADSGIKPAKTSAGAQPTNGWEARNGTLIAQDGILELTPDRGANGKGAFITRSQLRLAPPVTVRIVLKASATGPAVIAWRVDGDKDFLPARRTTFQITAANEWQTHEVSLPAESAVIHVRVHLPEGTNLIRELEFKQ